MKKIGYLGTGSWGFCLACLLGRKGYDVTSWTTNQELADTLNATGVHPRFPDVVAPKTIRFTTDIAEAVQDKELLVESVTTAGLRPVLEQVKAVTPLRVPLVLTSKGVELGSGMLLHDVVMEVFGKESKELIGALSGPSFAAEIIRGLPSSVVASAFNREVIDQIVDAFTTNTLRVYPNSDIQGVTLVGALKNPIAIACGIAEALNMGFSARAALMTRGLHEIKKLGVALGCRPETFSGLAGMGDLCMTSSSSLSRNFRFGALIGKGKSFKDAEEEIGMVVEGAYCAEAALKLSEETGVPLPIIEGVHHILHNKLQLSQVLEEIMKRSVKEEHL